MLAGDTARSTLVTCMEADDVKSGSRKTIIQSVLLFTPMKRAYWPFFQHCGCAYPANPGQSTVLASTCVQPSCVRWSFINVCTESVVPALHRCLLRNPAEASSS